VKWQFKFLFGLVIVFVIDQFIKSIFLDGFRWDGEWLSLILVYNKGVAFSMFSFLDQYLKYLQIILLLVVFGYFYKEKVLFKYPIVSGILFGAALSNIFDRFIHPGVVDYVYYHGWFDFAVFNFADVMIDFSIAMLIIFYYIKDKKEKKSQA